MTMKEKAFNSQGASRYVCGYLTHCALSEKKTKHLNYFCLLGAKSHNTRANMWPNQSSHYSSAEDLKDRSIGKIKIKGREAPLRPQV